MINRIEESIRSFMDDNLQDHYNFGRNRPPQNKKQQRKPYTNEVWDEAERMGPSIVTIRDEIGIRQVRKGFRDQDHEPEPPAPQMDQSSDEENIELRT